MSCVHHRVAIVLVVIYGLFVILKGFYILSSYYLHRKLCSFNIKNNHMSYVDDVLKVHLTRWVKSKCVYIFYSTINSDCGVCASEVSEFTPEGWLLWPRSSF